MEEKTKQSLIVVAAGVTLFAALMNFSAVLAFAERVIALVLPVIAGAILALFISVPMNGIEKRLRKLLGRRKRRPPDRLITVTSFALTLLCVVLVLVLALTLLIPELVKSCQSLYAQLQEVLPRWAVTLKEAGIDVEWLKEKLSGLSWEQVVQNLSGSLDTIASNAVGAVSSTVSVVVTVVFAVIISIYISLERQMLSRHASRLVRAYLKPAHAEGITRFCGLFRQSFASFLTGQCAEAVILGLLMALAFTVFRIPYGSLAGVLTAICALIPYVGAFISCTVSVFLVLLIDPMLGLRCLLVYLAVQFIENQFIYPRVVGSSVGLPPIYTLIAALIGAKLFGIIGIIFFIPLAAVVLELVRENAGKRIAARGGKPKPAPRQKNQGAGK